MRVARMEQFIHTERMDVSLDPRYGRLIFDTIPHGIFTVDDRGIITAFNSAAEEITGWARDEVIGYHCRNVFQSNHCVNGCFLFESIEVGQPHRDREVRIVCKNGVELPVSVSTSALRDESGKVVGGIEMFRDLSVEDSLRRQLEGNRTCGELISKSASMKQVCELLPLVARSESTVLIEGEPGTGKELVARSIHNLGPRAEGPFIAVNCGALPETLVESELFGHVRGAFTDAKRDHHGRFAMAQGGTLLLDEIGDVSPAMQVKLLRVLQEREYLPLGAIEPVPANVRILAATNRDLAQEVLKGNFRQDLYFRLNVVRIALPPLRARWEDIPLLVHHFVQRFNLTQGRRITGLSETAMNLLVEYEYPGNVRELENAIEHAFVVCGGNTIRLEDLPPHLRGDGPQIPTPKAPGPVPSPLGTAEARTIREALAVCDGNRTRAARQLGISRNTLWRKMKKHNII